MTVIELLDRAIMFNRIALIVAFISNVIWITWRHL
jgi:hypothetical protein